MTLRGAGPWYSVLGGRHPTDRKKVAGVYGKWANQGGSSDVTLRDFAIIGDVRERVDEDQVNAIGGAMSDLVIDNIWMQHTKCGAWMDGPMDNLTIRNSRILDQTADGVNFHYGVTNSTVTNTFVRNTGDDGLAMWAENVPNVNNSFTFNTVGVTLLANNIVSYGGRDIRITDANGTTPTTPPVTTPPPTTVPPTTPPPASGNLAARAGRSAAPRMPTSMSPATPSTATPTPTGRVPTNAFPQSVTVDLGTTRSVSRLVLKLPPAAAWQARTQTLAVLGSTNGSSFATLSPSAGRTFNSVTGNTATITFPATSQRYLTSHQMDLGAEWPL